MKIVISEQFIFIQFVAYSKGVHKKIIHCLLI